MDIEIFFIIAAITLMIIVFIPDIIPYCACCTRVKLRFMFKLHKHIGMGLGYSANKSVCKRCCKRYKFESFLDYDKYEKVRKKVAFTFELDKMKQKQSV